MTEDLSRPIAYMPRIAGYYRALGFAEGMFPESERYGMTALTLPLYAAMSDAQQLEVVEAVRGCL